MQPGQEHVQPRKYPERVVHFDAKGREYLAQMLEPVERLELLEPVAVPEVPDKPE